MLVTLTAFMLLATAVAGCAQFPQEAGDGEESVADDTPPGERWENNFTVPEDAQRIFVNVTVDRWSRDEGPVTVIVEGPDGTPVAERSAERDAGRDSFAVNMRFGDVEDPTADVDVEPGTWSLKVVTQGVVQVSGSVTVLDGDGEREVF